MPCRDDDDNVRTSPPLSRSQLEGIPTRRNQRRVYRLASISADDDFLQALGLDAQSQQELKDLLRASGGPESLEGVLDAPFRARRRLRMATRYSDGSYPVFYSSLDFATAEAEVAHWFMKGFSGSPQQKRTAYYQRFVCTFKGSEKDLRDKRCKWSELVQVDDYTFCNRIGAEAVALGLDGLVVPSARRRAGSNVPVFKRQAVSNPESRGTVSVAFDPQKGEVTTVREGAS